MRRGLRPTRARPSARIFKRDAIVFCRNLSPQSYDLAFADPPYGSKKLDRVVEQWHAVPFAAMLIVEHAADYAVRPGVWTFTHENSRVTAYAAPETPDAVSPS